MDQPWGLSGPQFLLVYGAGLVVALAAPSLLRLLIRWVPGARFDRQLGACEAGYLAGGPRRAAEVVIAELVSRGALRVDSTGRVRVADQSALGEWPGVRPDGTRVSMLQQQIARMPDMVVIGQRLRAEGLLLSRARALAVWLASLALWAALLVAGALRLAEGAHNHRPTSVLQGLFILSAIAGVFQLRRLSKSIRDARTALGARVLRRLRAAQRRAGRQPSRVGPRRPAVAQPVLPGSAFGVVPAVEAAALLGVALAGFAAVQDHALRTALLAGFPSGSSGSSWGGGGWGGGSSSSSCGGGGGSSCGGGGGCGG
jgi:uncharacterized protein (TIGR04222 family)